MVYVWIRLVSLTLIASPLICSSHIVLCYVSTVIAMCSLYLTNAIAHTLDSQ